MYTTHAFFSCSRSRFHSLCFSAMARSIIKPTLLINLLQAFLLLLPRILNVLLIPCRTASSGDLLPNSASAELCFHDVCSQLRKEEHGCTLRHDYPKIVPNGSSGTAEECHGMTGVEKKAIWGRERGGCPLLLIDFPSPMAAALPWL